MADLRRAALCLLGAVLAAPAQAFDVAEITTRELSDGSLLQYESSFCEVAVGDTVLVVLDGEDGDAAAAELVAASLKPQNGVTPKRGATQGGGPTASVSSVIGPDSETAELTVAAADAGWRTLHVRLELSSGDKLGVNLHATPCDPREADTTYEDPEL